MFNSKLKREIKELEAKILLLEGKTYWSFFNKNTNLYNRYEVKEILKLLLEHLDLEIRPASTKITLARRSES